MDFMDDAIQRMRERREVAGADEAAGDRVLEAIARVRERRASVDVEEALSRVREGDLQRVVDGDTVDLSKGKIRQRVRFAGIDAPELGQGDFGREAQAFLDDLVKEQKSLRRGTKIKDRRGRDVSILYAGDKNLNVELVRGGYAKVYRDYLHEIPDEVVAQLVQAEDEAKSKGIGVWSSDYVDAADWRRAQAEKDLSIYDRQVKDPGTMTVREVIDRVRARRGRPSLREEVEARGDNVFGIKRADRYVPEEGWLDRGLGALDYVGNMSRSFLKGSVEGGAEKGWKYLKEAAGKERHTSAENLRDMVTERADLGKVRFGKDGDGEIQAGDVADFALNVGTDIVTDPLTLVGTVFSAAAKGAKAGRLLGKVASQGAQDARVGLMSDAALRYGVVKAVTGGGIGAAYGVGAVDGDAPVVGKVAAGAAGAAVGAFGGKAIDKSGKVLREAADKVSDKYALMTRGEWAKDFTKNKSLELEAIDRKQVIADRIVQGKEVAFDGLSDAERLKTIDYLEQLKTEIIRRRQKAEKAIQGSPGTAKYNRAFNSMMKKINYDVAESFLPAIVRNESKNVVEALGKMSKHNDETVRSLNQVLFGIDEADSSMRNVGKSYTKGSFIKDPRDKRMYKAQEWYGSNRYSIEEMEDLKKMGLVRLDFGMFAGRDIALKNGTEIKKGTKITDFDFTQKKLKDGTVEYEKMVLQDGTVLKRDDVYLSAKNFQPYDPKNFKGGKGIVGLRFHIDDVYSAKDFKETEEALREVTIEKAKSLNRSKAGFKIAREAFNKRTGLKSHTMDDVAKLPAGEKALWDEELVKARNATYRVYAEKWAKKYLDDRERAAIKFMAEYRNAKVGKGVERFEAVLRGYDKVSNFVKANLLYTSLSWLKNNYWENLSKSYVENGLSGIMDIGTLGRWQKGLRADVSDLYANRLNRVHLNPHTAEMLELGVLDNPMYKAMVDVSTREYLVPPKKIKESELKGPLGVLEKAGRILLGNPISRGIAQVGSVMEGTARAVTYIRTKESLLSLPRFKAGTPEDVEVVKRIAAQVVKKTFFDYSDVTHLEAAVLKRMIPFYSFYSKNLPYWIKAMFEPEKVHRVVALEKIRRGMGEQPSKYEKSGMTPYIADQAPRSFGKDRKGHRVFGVMPAASHHDAIKMMNPLEAGKQLVEKGHPIPKLAYELATRNDLFDGQKLLPSDSPQGKKFLFSRGHKYSFLPQLEVDSNGNPYTESDWLVIFDRVLSTVWPHGLVDQVAGSVGKVYTGKESATEALLNRTSPVQRIKVSPAYERMVRLGKRRGEVNGD
jgi:endonuclease YncB( thermonuclease family)